MKDTYKLIRKERKSLQLEIASFNKQATGILFAGQQAPEKHWKDAAAGAMDAMAAELRAALL